MFELSNDLIMIYDRNHVIRLINPAVRTLLGYEPDEVIGREWSKRRPPRGRSGRLRADRGRLRAEGGGAGDGAVRDEGRPDWCSVRLAGAYDPEDDAMLYVGRDVTGDVEHRTRWSASRAPTR